MSPYANSSEFAGVIGAFASENSVIAANSLQLFRISQISYSSSTVKLSNKNNFYYFFRTIPPNSFFAPALVDFLKIKTRLVLYFSTETWADTGAQNVKNTLKKNNICIANDLKLVRFPQDKDFDDVLKRSVINDEPNIVILITIQRDSRELLKAKKRNPRSRRPVLCWESWLE